MSLHVGVGASGGASSLKPWLESTIRFQTLIVKKDYNSAFNLNPGKLFSRDLRRYASASMSLQDFNSINGELTGDVMLRQGRPSSLTSYATTITTLDHNYHIYWLVDTSWMVS